MDQHTRQQPHLRWGERPWNDVGPEASGPPCRFQSLVERPGHSLLAFTSVQMDGAAGKDRRVNWTSVEAHGFGGSSSEASIADREELRPSRRSARGWQRPSSSSGVSSPRRRPSEPYVVA